MIALEYLREYRTYFHIGKAYGISESNAYKTIKWVENILIKDPLFALPGKKVLLKSDFEFFDLIVGMDESNVEDLLQVSAGRYDDKIKLFRPGGVPDPWYTGDFEETYNLVTAACQDWLQWIRDRQ